MPWECEWRSRREWGGAAGWETLPPEPAHHAPAPSRATLANRQRRSSYMGWDKAGDPLTRPGLLQSRAPPRGHEPARGGGLLAPCSECYWALQQTWQTVTEGWRLGKSREGSGCRRRASCRWSSARGGALQRTGGPRPSDVPPVSPFHTGDGVWTDISMNQEVSAFQSDLHHPPRPLHQEWVQLTPKLNRPQDRVSALTSGARKTRSGAEQRAQGPSVAGLANSGFRTPKPATFPLPTRLRCSSVGERRTDSLSA